MDNVAANFDSFITFKNSTNTEIAAIQLKEASQDLKINTLTSNIDSNKELVQAQLATYSSNF